MLEFLPVSIKSRETRGASTTSRPAFLIMAQFMRVSEGSWKPNLRRICQVLERDGYPVFIKKVGIVLRDLVFRRYGRWVALYDTLDQSARQYIEADIAGLPSGPVISIIIPISG